MPIFRGELLAVVESAGTSMHNQNTPTRATNTDTHPAGTWHGED